MKFIKSKLIIALAVFAAACGQQTASTDKAAPSESGLAFAVNNDSLKLGAGFKAVVVTEGLQVNARHMTVRDNGDIYVKVRTMDADSSILAMRDTNGDGVADVTKFFDSHSTVGTGIAIDGDYLYASSVTDVYRYKFDSDDLLPNLKKDTIVKGMIKQRSHEAKGLAFDDAGHIYVSIGGPSNACMEQSRTKGSPGQDPCPQLDLQAGIWQFSKNTLNQVHGQDGKRYATGMRNPMALDWNTATNGLFSMTHGRDQLDGMFPDLFSAEDNANFTAEEFFQVDDGDDFGWPYCFYHQEKKVKYLNPEYGGDGQIIARCEDKKNPIYGFPAHMAPNDMLFYTGDQFPAKYKNGAFIAFHGSWNRAPLPQEGFYVAFVPFKDGKISGEFEVFADGFSRLESVESPGDAKHRPMGLAQGPDGSLYVCESVKGKVWRIVYNG